MHKKIIIINEYLQWIKNQFIVFQRHFEFVHSYSYINLSIIKWLWTHLFHVLQARLWKNLTCLKEYFIIWNISIWFQTFSYGIPLFQTKVNRNTELIPTRIIWRKKGMCNVHQQTRVVLYGKKQFKFSSKYIAKISDGMETGFKKYKIIKSTTISCSCWLLKINWK